MSFLRTVIGLVLLVATIGLTSCESYRVAVSDGETASSSSAPISSAPIHHG